MEELIREHEKEKLYKTFIEDINKKSEFKTIKLNSFFDYDIYKLCYKVLKKFGWEEVNKLNYMADFFKIDFRDEIDYIPYSFFKFFFNYLYTYKNIELLPSLPDEINLKRDKVLYTNYDELYRYERTAISYLDVIKKEDLIFYDHRIIYWIIPVVDWIINKLHYGMWLFHIPLGLLLILSILLYICFIPITIIVSTIYNGIKLKKINKINKAIDKLIKEATSKGAFNKLSIEEYFYNQNQKTVIY